MKYVESGEGYSHGVNYTYNDRNNLATLIENINSAFVVTEYAYDENDRVTSLTSSLLAVGTAIGIFSSVKEFTYDSYNRVSNWKIMGNGSALLTKTFTYRNISDGSDNTIQTTGQVEKLEISTNDNAGSFNTSLEYDYDANGNILSVSDGTNTTSYTYDTAGQLLRENNQAAGKTWVWTYDNAGNILSRMEYAYTTGTLGAVVDTVNYGYNNANWGDLLTSYNGKNITYDAIGNPVNDGTWTYTWEHGRQLASMTNGTTTIDYEYNADGIRTKKTVTTASNHTHVFQDTVIAPTCTENGYTLHSCVCGYIYQDSPVAAIGHTFTTRVVGSTCTANGYTLKECACGYSYQEGSSGHTFTTLVVEPTETVNGFTRHTCECGYSYESDPVVSLCTDEGAEEPVIADTEVYDYVYNGTSLTCLTITTTTYGESPVVETLYFGNGTVTYNGEVYYYVTNLQGDVIAILNSAGTAVVEYTYDAWGNILTTTGSMASTLGVANPLTYRGYVYDTESGLYYLQSRYYNPNVGRFINADDPAYLGAKGILSNNLFAYCGNNPVMGYDPTGTWDWGTAFSGAGLLATGLAAVAAAATILTCGAAAPLMVAVATVTAAAGVLTTVNGVAEVVEAGTGYNAVRDGVFGGNAEAYETYRDVTSAVAEIGTAICGAYYTAKGGNVCFVAGTLVQSELGPVPIETVSAGMMVWAWDEDTGDVALKEVVETYINETDEFVHVFVNGEEIVCTPSHPFYSPIKGWTDAVHLRAGDILVLVNGEYVVVEKVQHEILEAPVTVYNFQVEDYHTYYVADSGVLVHNRCIVDENGVRVEVRTSNEHGLPHAHVFDGKVNTTIGLDQTPMPGHPSLTSKMRKVVQSNWEAIVDGINRYFPKTY